MKLHGTRALIVGGTSGIGLATARCFVAQGAEITIVARSADTLAQVAREIGGQVQVFTADVGDAAQCSAIVPHAVSLMGGLEAVVYCAGLCEPRLLADIDVITFKTTLDVNLTGNFIVAQAAALFMRDNGGGSIVNISSELSHIGMAHYVHYCAAKAGVLGLTMALAAEMAPTVRVNSISPGPVDTPMMAAEMKWFGDDEALWTAARERVPLKRFASPDEIASSVLFLTADAKFATGTTLRLDGGTTIT